MNRSFSAPARVVSRGGLRVVRIGSPFFVLVVLVMCVAVTTVAAFGTGGAVLQVESRFTKADSDAFVRKMLMIERLGATPARPATVRPGARSGAAPAARMTPITERELNAYFRYDMRDQFPGGVTEPTITILGDGRVSATAVVDLDAVRNGQDSGWLSPMRLLSGRLPVTASGVLETQHGTARFTLDSADVSGVPVPKGLLQQVVSYYSRTAENPQGVNLDDAFELPAGIQEIRVQPGQAIVVQ